jgi:trimeric autotransporter adhesin
MIPVLRFCGVLCLSVVISKASSLAIAQCGPGEWLQGESVAGVIGSVSSLAAWDIDGPNGPLPELVVVGGLFTVAGDQAVRNLATYDPNSQRWSSLGGGTNGEVHRIVVLPDGSLAIGGSFSEAGQTLCNNVAIWRNQAWEPLASGTSGRVRALCVSPDGDLLVGGAFTLAGGMPASRIARWNGSSWSSIGAGFLDGDVRGIGFLPDGTLVAAGPFLVSGSRLVRGFARWTGEEWVDIAGGFFNGRPAGLHITPGGELIVFGGFTFANDRTINRVARFDGVSWQPLGDGFQTTGSTVRELITMPNGHLLAIGSFQDGDRRYVAGWNGTEWYGLDSGLRGVLSQSFAAVALADGNILVGGSFNRAGGGGLPFEIGGAQVSNIARWNGEHWNPVNTDLASGAIFDALRDGFTLVRGPEAFRGVVGSGTAKLGPLGDVLPLPPGLISFTPVTEGPDGSLYGIGVPTASLPSTQRSILELQGSEWVALGGLNTTYSNVFDLITLPDGRLLAAGQFPAYEPIYENLLVWNGTAWHPFEWDAPFSGPIRCFARGSSGEVLAGMRFETGGPAPFAVLQLTGAGWTGMTPHLNGGVDRIIALDDGTIVALGSFAQNGAWTTGGLARLRPGHDWETNWGVTTEGFVHAVAAYPQGRLLVSGSFTSIGGTPTQGLAFFDGENWTSPVGAPDGTIYSLAVQPNGDVLMGGDFRLAGGRVSPYIATWRPNCSPLCSDIDFNNDGQYYDPTDVDALLAAFSEGTCVPPSATCDPIDFNNDGAFFDPCDIHSFLLAFSEGPCTLCGQ